MKHMTQVLLRLLANAVQGQNTPNTVFPLNTGRWSCMVWWSRRNRSAQWRLHTVSRKKRSVASFVLIRTSMFSKKRNCTTCRDGYAHRVFLLCSRRKPLHSQHHGYQRHYLLSSTKRHLNCCPLCKQGGWDGRTPGAALWRHRTQPQCHMMSITGEDGSHLDTRWIAHGEQVEKPS